MASKGGVEVNMWQGGNRNERFLRSDGMRDVSQLRYNKWEWHRSAWTLKIEVCDDRGHSNNRLHVHYMHLR